MIEHFGLKDKVKLLGFVDNPYAYMALSDLLVITSKYEGICNVIVEALGCGCPVVASDCPGGGPREILEDGKWGYLFPVGDVETLTNSMLSALQDDFNKEALKQRAAFFSYETGMKNYSNMFSET